MGEEKLIAFNSCNPIVFTLPKVLYEDCLRYEESLEERNKRLLNIYSVQNQQNNPTFSATKLLGLSENQIEICAK